MKLKTKVVLTSAVALLLAGAMMDPFPWSDSFTWSPLHEEADNNERVIEYQASWSPRNAPGEVIAQPFLNGKRVGNAPMKGRVSPSSRTQKVKVGDTVSMRMDGPEVMDLTCTIKEKSTSRVYVHRPQKNVSSAYCTAVVS